MNARRLGRAIAVIAVIVAVLMWWSRQTSQRAPAIVAIPTPASAPLSSPQANLDADPLALVRAPAEVVSQPTQDASASTAVDSEGDDRSFLVIDHTTRAPLAGMGVQLQWGPLVTDYNSNWLHGVSPIEHTDEHARVHRNGDEYENFRVVAWDPAGHLGSAFIEVTPFEAMRKGDIVLELSPDNDFVFWMRIVDEETGSPVAGARDTVAIDMSLPSADHVPSYFSFQDDSQLSDANGLLLCKGPAWTEHMPELKVPDHATVWVVAEKGHERADKALLVQTPRSATVHLHVVDTNGLPVRDCHVRLHAQSNQEIRPRPAQVEEDVTWFTCDSVTDAFGNALIEGLPPDMELRGETSGVFNYRLPPPMTLAPGEVRNVEWVLAGGVTLRGTVYDQAGTPVPNCEVWLERTRHERPGYFDETSRPDRSARTDASGRFVFASAEVGRFWIGPGRTTNYPDSFRKDVAPITSIVDVVARAEVDVELHTACGLFVSGRVLPPADKPLLEGTITVEDRARKLSMSGPWSADGSFSIGPLMDGSYAVAARSKAGYAPPDPIVVDAGAQDVKLEMGATTSISGRVVDDQGRKVQCTVLLTSQAAGSGVPSIEQYSTEGEFSFDGLAPGKYSIAAQSSRRLMAAVDGVEAALGASVTDVALRLAPAGLVRFRCSHTMAWDEVTLLQNGVRFVNRKFEGYNRETIFSPPGKVTLRLRNTETGAQCEHAVSVDVDKITDLTIEDEGR